MGSGFPCRTRAGGYRAALKIEEISVASDDIILRGTLQIPENARDVVIFVHGSGPLDRNQDHAGAPLGTFRVLADAVGAIGFASLRWDKRGVGASGGNYPLAGQADLIADVSAMIDFAQARGLGRIFLCGHSEGTALAPVAAQGREIAGLILICPYVTPGSEILVQQAARADEHVAKMTGWKGVLARLMGRPSMRQKRFVARLAASKGDFIRVGFRKIPAKWLRDFATSDVARIHSENKRPTLLIVAENDVQCPPEDGAKIAKTNQLAKLVEIPELSHILRHTTKADLADYARQLTEPQDPRVAQTVTHWLLQQTDTATNDE